MQTTTPTNTTIGTADAADLSARTRELARDATDTLAARANEVGSRGMSSLGRKLNQAADSVAETGANLAQDSRAPIEMATVDKVTASVRGAADYLDTQDPRGVMTDVDGAVHRHPYRAMAIGAACGWIIGRLVTSR